MEDLFKQVNPYVMAGNCEASDYEEFFAEHAAQTEWYEEASEMAKASLNTHARLTKKRAEQAVAQ